MKRIWLALLALTLIAAPAHAAIRCDGVNDSIVYGHVAAIDGRSTLTISFWYKPLVSTGNDYYARVISQEAANAGNGFMVSMGEFNEANLTLAFRNGDPNQSGLDAGSPFTQDAWQHIYIRWDASEGFANQYFDDRVKLWKNGTQINPPGFYGANNMPTAMGTVTEALALCKSPGTSTYWHGEIAEVGIWLDNDTTRVASLASGQAPSFFQSNLHVYLPLISGDGSVDVEGNAGAPTVSGAANVAHPSGITYPAGAPAGAKYFIWNHGERTDAEWTGVGNDTPGGSIARVP